LTPDELMAKNWFKDDEHGQFYPTEINQLKQLKGTIGVVQLVTHFQDDHLVYILLDHVPDAMTLRQLLTEFQGDSALLNLAQTLVSQLAIIAQECLYKEIDIRTINVRPESVLVSTGGRWEIHLFDFGRVDYQARKKMIDHYMPLEFHQVD